MISFRRLMRALVHPVSLRKFALNLSIVVAMYVACSRLAAWQALLLIAAGFLLYYQLVACAPTRIYHGPSASGTGARILAAMPCLRGGGYRPSFWFMNSHLNTVWGAMRPYPAEQRVRREIAHGIFPDGEQCVLDWFDAPPHLAERAAADWSDGLVTSYRDAADFLERLEFTRVQRQRHPGTAAAMGVVPRRNPVIVVFHGLTSGCNDNNICRLIERINEMGWDAVVPVRRGCSDDPALLTRPKYYAYGGLEDTSVTVEHIARAVPDQPLFAVGLSAGSNVGVNYLATQGRYSLIQGAVSVANGYCWRKGTELIRDTQPVWDVLMSTLMKMTMLSQHAHVVTTTHTFEKAGGGGGAPPPPPPPSLNKGGSLLGPLLLGSPVPQLSAEALAALAAATQATVANTQQLRTAGSMREIDDILSKSMHGFECLEEFYAEQSCCHRLHRIKVPVLFLNAADDPVAGFPNIPIDGICCNDNTLLVVTPRGGHLGYSQGALPFGGASGRATVSWMDDFVVQGLTGLMAEAKHRLRNVHNFSGTAPFPQGQPPASAASDSAAAAAGAAAAAAAVAARMAGVGANRYEPTVTAARGAAPTPAAAGRGSGGGDVRVAGGVGGGGMMSQRRLSSAMSAVDLATTTVLGIEEAAGTPPEDVSASRRQVVSTPTMQIPRSAAMFPSPALVLKKAQ